MRGDIRRLVIIGIGTAALLMLAVGLLAPVFPSAFCAPAQPLEWLVVAVSIGVIVGLAWYLMAFAPRHGADPEGYHVVACESCGRAVLTEWRLCPYCGAALAPQPTPDEETVCG